VDDVAHPDGAAVGRHDPVVERVILDLAHGRGAARHRVGAIVRMNQVRPELRLAQPPGDRIPQQPLGCLTHVRELHGSRIGLPHDGVEVVEQCSALIC